MKRRPLFEAAWYFVNAMLVFSAIFCLYSFAWEYSTRKYLQGFSEAIIPATATPIEKVETILNWMSNGPARRTSQDPHGISDRDPEETLNYQALLRVCGTATNAFTNLANASGLPSRRLLLLNGGKTAKHVVAEVWINNQWIVVDPSFRVIPRGPDGGLLTRDDLAEPATFNYVFERVPGYDMAYT
ncbi:MAG: transglutaminase-like domain-containing protein, partial [Candidatus Acidiferrales bacterium]